MNAAFTVHSAADTRESMPVTLPDGSEAVATVAGYVVELVPANGQRHGTVTLRFSGADVQQARDTFVLGRSIAAAFTGV
jgi:hypothetical protein